VCQREYEPGGLSAQHHEHFEQEPSLVPTTSPTALSQRSFPISKGDSSSSMVTPVKNSSYFALELEELQDLKDDGHRGRRPMHRFETNARYLGQWKGNARHGHGQQIWADGAEFTGQWSESLAEGLGQLVHPDGDVFVGQWHQNAAEGLGIYYRKQGQMISAGEWLKDIQHGHTVERWENGSEYNGQYVQGRKHGYGVYRWPDGSAYSGQWIANSINGYGHYIGKDGREFRGTWKDAVIHGCGEYSWPDGRSYSGQYAHDQKHGFGVFTLHDGRSYEGFWRNGYQHGCGVTYSSTGAVLKKGTWDMGHQLETPEETPETCLSQGDATGEKGKAEKKRKPFAALGRSRTPKSSG